ncbi:uncharacterized protein LOC110462629 [Mizuhopecten yessoensis]|uniref:P2X purinoceptor 7 n=1 Tax=Mizuhopecten yessoensis TaxID=6573 RepID=A0A210PXW6_MIZYE|nr:uncharacterized protein LOC110462629 [Mizuhopecten yessoensis]OWF41326.1 P2X purinoceptor 7 [Mizuhopecten yessoensis]
MAESTAKRTIASAQTKTGQVREFSSDEDAYKFISDEESRTYKKYQKPQTVPNFHDNTSGCHICWDDVNNFSRCGSSLSYDGIPFIILGNEEMACIQDPCKGNRKRKLMSDGDHDYGVLEKTTCLARVKICKIIKFPQFKNKGRDTKGMRTILSEKLKELFKQETTVKEYKVFVRMPEEDEHDYTPPPEVEIEGPVKIPLNDLLKSLPKKLLGSMVKQEPIEVQDTRTDAMTITGAKEKVVQKCDIGNVQHTKGEIDLASTSPRNIAATALVSMNTVSAIPKQVSLSAMSSQTTSESQVATSSAQLFLLETQGQIPKYVMLNTTQVDVGERAPNTMTPVRTAQSAKKPRMSFNGNNDVTGAVALPARTVKPVPWRGIEGSVTVSDTCFYTQDRNVMEECIQKYEDETYSVFRCNKTTNTKVSELIEVSSLDNHRVRWCPLSEQWKPADYVPDNIPYLVLRIESRMCRFSSKLRSSKSKKLKKKEWCVSCNRPPEEQKSSTDVCTCRLRKTQKPMQKMPCPAVIAIHTIIRYSDFRADTKKKRVEMSKNLKCGLGLIQKFKMRLRQERRIYVTVPRTEVHQNHPIFKVPKLDNPCCPCHRTGTCGKCQCKLTGCLGCNNNECRYRDSEGNFKPLRQVKKKKKRMRRCKGSPYAAKSIRNIRINPDELSLNEQLNREAELEVFQENSVVLKMQQEIMGMSLENARSTLLQMLEDDPVHVESYVSPDNAPYHRVQIDTPPKWCSCTQCVEMDNSSMEMCCAQKPCLSFHPMFRSVCLRPDHLLMGILDLGLPAESFSELGNVSNAQYRRQAYRCFILWQWHNLGKGEIEVPKPPSCVVARIRWRYPSIDNHFGDTFSPESDFEEGNK